jgi:hypothetical protein
METFVLFAESRHPQRDLRGGSASQRGRSGTLDEARGRRSPAPLASPSMTGCTVAATSISSSLACSAFTRDSGMTLYSQPQPVLLPQDEQV